MLLRHLFTTPEFELLKAALDVSVFYSVDDCYQRFASKFTTRAFSDVRAAHVDVSAPEHIICLLGVLNTGEWFVLSGGVDADGVVWGEVNTAHNKEVLLAFGVTDSERSLLKI